ncbi:antibiotic biosynthesis monooxygenase family protein [Streptomyces sp. NPDC002574]|uniref:antibiotic biosynthesis monooxygenase family protein n=1 Tax=Streptomyces sp. NPDC002574 TaxID=3364652 RepID=UPI0036BBC5EC
MIELADVDETSPYPKQLLEETGPVVLVNTIVAPDGKEAEVLAAWTQDSVYFKSRPGFISAQMHKGVGSSRALMNIAVWESAGHLHAALTSPEFRGAAERYPDGTVAHPHLYERLAVQGVCVG